MTLSADLNCVTRSQHTEFFIQSPVTILHYTLQKIILLQLLVLSLIDQFSRLITMNNSMNDCVIDLDDVSGVQTRPKKRIKQGSEEITDVKEVDSDDVSGSLAEMIKEILAEMRELRIEMVGIKGELRKEVGDMLKEELSTVNSKVEEIKSDIKEEMTKQSGVIEHMKERIEKSEKEITDLNTKIEKELRGKNRDLVSRLEAVEKKLSNASATMKDLRWKSIDCESRMRRNNLIFYGIKEEKDENCFRKIEKFLNQELNIKESVAMQRAHRMGKHVPPNYVGQKAGRPRPIIVNFIDHRQREAIRAARSKLKQPHGISEDLPYEVRKAREKLIPQLKELKLKGKNCSIVWPARLICEGKLEGQEDVTKYARK